MCHRLPPDVAEAAVEFITGPILQNPQRVGRALVDEHTGIHSARLRRNWHVLYEIDDAKPAGSWYLRREASRICSPRTLWFDRRDDDTPSVASRGGAVTVELASKEMMLALKTIAGRDQDIADAHILMNELGVTTSIEVRKNLAWFTGRGSIESRAPTVYLRGSTLAFLTVSSPVPARCEVLRGSLGRSDL